MQILAQVARFSKLFSNDFVNPPLSHQKPVGVSSTHAHHLHLPLRPCYPGKSICPRRCDYDVYCTPANGKRRIRSRRQEAGSNRPGDTSLICQPCETTGQGLVMWFRWVSHAGVSQPSPLSAPATVPHYAARHHRLYRLLQALWFLTRRRPFLQPFFLLKWQEGLVEGKKKFHASVQLRSLPASPHTFRIFLITVADD